MDASATNGAAWGKTILPGHNVPGGWFGVDVCANGTNTSAPNGSNVSCDRIPSNWASAGCAPGGATSDGYGLTYQCVELVIRFSAWAYGDSAGDWGKLGWGNAPDLWDPGNHPSDFDMYPNGSATPPVPGDILVWGSVDAKGQPLPAGPDGQHGGHIAVVAAVHGNVVVTAEQNVKWGNLDHPSDTLALTKVGNRWVLSGSMAHETALPTYRWRGTMGTSRATYGWLHSTKNTDSFPSANAGKTATTVHHTTGTTPAQTPAHTTPKQASGGLPSVSQGVFVVNGALADLVWSAGDPFVSGASSAAPTAPTAQLRGLAAPPGVTLASGQRPAIVMESDGRRFVYVVGSNGRLYEAITSTVVLGVQWQDLGAPANITLGGSASATLFT
ncbi:MAG: CHAP domain-containing protein, partial [Ktedonobacterales bacterium]